MNNVRALLLIVLLLFPGVPVLAQAVEYVSPVKPADTGGAPVMQVKLIGTTGTASTYAIIFQPGDEVVSGLTKFAMRYDVKSAHYQGIGDAASAQVGWYDKSRKMFKVIRLDQPVEVTSLLGDIASYNGKPVAHTHINLSDEARISHGGHLLQLIVGPTLEVFVTVEQTPLFKRLNVEYGAAVIDPALDR